MAEKTKAKFEAQTEDEKYLHAEKLLKAIDCLTRDKERAEIYEYVANIYKELGEYKDAKEKYEECDKKAKEHKKLAAEHKDTNPKVEEDEKKSSGIVGKIILVIIGILVVAVIAVFVYTRTTPGKYARASYYQKTGNYQKAYKMFRTLGGYKDSEAKLAKTELGVIKKAKVGANVLYGGYHWLILEKKDDKVMLVKSEPINGFAYNDKNEDVTWETCSLRKYLNGEFLEETFTKEMRGTILDTDITVSDNDLYGTKGGNSTTDKIFLLNSIQAEKKYNDILANYLRDCWLIDPGSKQNTAMFMSYGKIMEYGYEVTNTNMHIRPAVWISVK